MSQALTVSFRVSLFFAGALLALIPFSVHALGLSPPTMVVDGLLRGTTQTRTVTLFRAPEDIGNVYIKVQPDEKSTEFFILDETQIVMVEGQTQIDYEFEITPGDAANGDYEWKLRFLKTPDPTAPVVGAGVSVITGVTAQLLVTVGGEEVLAYTLDGIYGDPTEEGLEAFVTYTVSNTGNVDWRPTEIVFAFFDVSGERVGDYTLTKEEIEPVQAGQTSQSFNVSVPVELVRGSYTVSATFYDGETEVGSLESTQPFEVYAPGTLAQSGTLKGLSVNKDLFFPGEKAKLTATFQNDGEILLTALLVTELSRDGQILDLLRGQEIEVNPGEEFVFTEWLDTSEEGDYQVNAYVEYGKKQTEAQQTSFTVSSKAASTDSSFGDAALGFFNSIVGLSVLAIGFILMAMLIILVKRRKKHMPVATISTPPVQTQSSPSALASSIAPPVQVVSSPASGSVSPTNNTRPPQDNAGNSTTGVS